MAGDTSVQQEDLNLTDRELLYRLGWFTRIRWVMGGLALLILLVGWFAFGVRLHRDDGPATMAPAVNVVLAVFLYNAAFTFLVHIMRARGKITRRLIVELALGQLACDMIAICALAHFTGGVENFFIIIVLLPLVIATELLPKPLAYATAAGAAVLINALAWGEQQGIISHISAAWPGGGVKAWIPTGGIMPAEGPNLYANPYYVLEVTAALTVAIFATVFVASSISSRLWQREAQLEDAYGALRLADEAKSFFMRKAGHEMRAPLAAIHSILEAITHTADTMEAEHRRLLGRTQQRTRALMNLVDDLRRYSRLRTPQSILEIKPLGVEKLVGNTVELFQQQAEDQGVSMSCKAEPVRLNGDEELLREMITNLVANAIQYTPSGGNVRVELSRTGREAVFSVADTGIGVSNEFREKLFEEFHRSPEAKKMLSEGTGLGLAITKRIAEAHGGRIEFSPGDEGGSVFTVRLPLRREDSGQQDGAGA